jgi:hypothetical protein
MERLHGQKPVQAKPKDKAPTWLVVFLILSLVLVVGLGTVMFLDLRRGELLRLWPKNATATTSVPKDMSAISVDTVKEKLVAKGFEVDYLQLFTDHRLLAFNTVATYIDKKPARIMTFKDNATAKRWIEGADVLTVSKDTWIVATNNEPLAQRMAKALKADLHG